MRILIFSGYYRPDGGPAAPLFTMLAEGLVQRGHDVTVITAVPHYPTGRVPDGYRYWIPRTTVENGVSVMRLPLPSLVRSSFLARAVQFAAYQLGAAGAGFFHHFDVLLAHSPGLEVWLPFTLHSRLRAKPAVYSVHDVYPDVGIRLGIFKNHTVVDMVTWLEKACLKTASRVRVLSKSFIPRLIELGVPEEKISLIYDWVEVDEIRPLPKENSFTQEYGLAGTFNVLYAGNMGAVQGLETLLEAANLLRGNADIRFVLVGDGAARAGLEARARHLDLPNTTFIPYQPRTRMPEVLACADAAVVMLKKGAGFGALPSKTYSLLASGRPVIASLDEGSDAWDLIQRSQAGICVLPENPGALADAILCLVRDKDFCKDLSQSGREYVIHYHSAQYASKQFEQVFLAVKR